MSTIIESLDKARLRLGGLGYHDEARDMASAMSQANKISAALSRIESAALAALNSGDVGALIMIAGWANDARAQVEGRSNG